MRAWPGRISFRFFLLCTLFLPTVSLAKDYLTITTDPPGAKVEIDGDIVGTTPYRIQIPGAYLSGTHTVWGLRNSLVQKMHLRLLLDGYLPKEEDLARGPY